MNIKEHLEDLNPIYSETLDDSLIESYRGFHAAKKVWYRILVNAIPIETTEVQQSGFKIQRRLMNHPPIILFDDCARLDYLLDSCKDQGGFSLYPLLEAFIRSYETALEISERVSLAPHTVFINNGCIIFCEGLHSDKDEPTLLSWIRSIITADSSFLHHDDLVPLIDRWEGRLPRFLYDLMQDKTSNSTQISLVKKWLESVNKQESTLADKDVDFVFDLLHDGEGVWSRRASTSILLLDPSEMTSSQAAHSLQILLKWNPNILLWSVRNRRFVAPSITWFSNLIRKANTEITPEKVIKCLPLIVWSTIQLIGHPSDDEIRYLCETLLSFEWKSDDIASWLQNPQFASLWSVSSTNRPKLLPLALLTLPKVLGAQGFNLALTCITETNLSASSGFDAFKWELIRHLIIGLKSPWGNDQLPNNTVEILEDLLNSVRANVPDGNIHRIEALASFIATHSWARNREAIHATGEMWTILRKSYDRTLLGTPSPYLDLAGIMIEYNRSVNDHSWRSLAEDWKTKYPEHSLVKVVSSLLGDS